jgi:hypothetical protein
VYGNSLHELDYTWSGLDHLSQYGDGFMVKVHYVGSEGKILFQDDHSLKMAQNGYAEHYKRQVLIPLIPRSQEVRMLVGLFRKNDDNKYAIQQNDSTYIPKLPVATFKVMPPVNIDDLPEARITFLDGWYAKEYGQSPTDSWRWIQPEAKCKLKGADKDLVLYIHGWIPEENLKSQFDITLYLDGNELGVYKSLQENFIIKRVIEKDEIGDGQFAELKIVSNKSFCPADFGHVEDSRNLSAMVKDIYFN